MPVTVLVVDGGGSQKGSKDDDGAAVMEDDVSDDFVTQTALAWSLMGALGLCCWERSRTTTMAQATDTSNTMLVMYLENIVVGGGCSSFL